MRKRKLLAKETICKMNNNVYIRYHITAFFVMLVMTALAQPPSAIDSVMFFHHSTQINSGQIQREQIYLHLDNTSYYRNDRLYFAGYLVTSGKLTPSNLSRTIYVELLNPSGKIIDRLTLRVVDGRFHGSFLVNEVPFYSGYYEIRAYTRYMLNFGEKAIFSRVIPVFKEPEVDGDWANRSMLKYGSAKYPFTRPKPAKTENVNIGLYPEGGHLVNGLPAYVAFELTDGLRLPLQGNGRVIDKTADSIVATFSSSFLGRGSFAFTPKVRHDYRAEVDVNGKKYSVKLPEVEMQGIALSVDNLSSDDSIKVTVRRTPHFPSRIIGASVMCRGELYSRTVLDMSEDDEVGFSISRTALPTGVIQLTLFDGTGSVLGDRLFFNNSDDLVRIEHEFDKATYGGYAPINLTLKSSSTAPFSLSVTDAADQVAYGSNFLADLLLASEIKGYVHNPAWYFENASDSIRRLNLDRLLMVQGWRKYSWGQLAGKEPIRIDSLPEQGIEVHGSVVGRWRNTPKKDATVTAFLKPFNTHVGVIEGSAYQTILDYFVTDSVGRFAFSADVYGKWFLILDTTEKGKVAKNRVLLNLSSRPDARAYDIGEMQIALYSDDTDEDKSPAENDTINLPIAPGAIRLKEVDVWEYSRNWEIAQYKENSLVSHDIESKHNELQDRGVKVLRKLTDLLPLIDESFYYIGPQLTYRGRESLYVLEADFANNSAALDTTGINYISPHELPLEAIKNVYINNKPDVISTYASMYLDSYDFHTKMSASNRFGCVVFIELHPRLISHVRQGMRRTVLEGYANPIEFYSPNYHFAPPIEVDRRRTLYWNPTVLPDSTGNAHVRFFNNSTARKFHITTATFPLL